MSQKYGYFCLTCGYESEAWFNHGQDALSNLFRDWPAIRAVLLTPVVRDGWLEVTVDTSMGYVDGEEGPLEFLMKHGEHHLALCDEYHRLSPIREQEKQIWQRGIVFYWTLNDAQIAAIGQLLGLTERAPHDHEVYDLFKPYMGGFVPTWLVERVLRDREAGDGPDLAV